MNTMKKKFSQSSLIEWNLCLVYGESEKLSPLTSWKNMFFGKSILGVLWKYSWFVREAFRPWSILRFLIFQSQTRHIIIRLGRVRLTISHRHEHATSHSEFWSKFDTKNSSKSQISPSGSKIKRCSCFRQLTNVLIDTQKLSLD